MTEIDVKPPYKLPTFHNWTPQATFYHPLQAGSIDGTDLLPHDKGVLRAMLSRYKPNKSVTGDPNKTLFVGRLSKDTSEDTIRNIFESFGELEKCRLVRDFALAKDSLSSSHVVDDSHVLAAVTLDEAFLKIVTGFSRGFAFVEFRRKRDALYAAAETHKIVIDGREILVDLEYERNLEGWKPRRLGGGFGGRKESGQLRFGGIDRPFKRPLPSQVECHKRGAERERRDERSLRRDWDRRDLDRHRERDHGGYERERRDRDDYRTREGYRNREDYRKDRRDRDRKERDKDRGRERDRDRDRTKDRDRDRRRKDRYSEDNRRSRVEFADRERRRHRSRSQESVRSSDRDSIRDKEDVRDTEET